MHAPTVSWEALTLKLRNPFHLSYGVSETRQSFWIRLGNDEGWGEAAIPPYYRVDPSAMISCWQRAGDSTQPLPDQIEQIAPWIPQGPAPSRCALELALLDRIGKKRNLPLWKLLEVPEPKTLSSCFTISIDTPDAMARMARQIEKYPLIKIKMGSDDDESRLRAVREARPDARLVVDANAGWTRDAAVEHLKWLEQYRLELIEQPLAKDDHEGMGLVQLKTKIPIVGDESVQTMDDVEKLARAGVRGINVKIMKVGGVIPALTMIRRARELGMNVMLGCMIETSIGTTAMAHLIGLADWIDLDSPLLISNDPFEGLTYDEHARVTVPDRAGIGVRRRGETAA
ncbi:MAG TPA: dipeptide epimerase [Tepidisphaeraceae bacterium]|jgi:L-alanine-DL-glutamate epimerase-like enolase superfamily enzyme